MPYPTLLLTDTVTPEVEAAIGNGLNAFNVEQAGYGDSRPIAVLVREPGAGAVIGGAVGRTSLGLLFIDLVYLPASHRGRGTGSEVLRMLEEEAKRRGCVAGVLYTISFQAPGFYQRHGWTRFGEVPCLPPGTSRVFLTKRFDAP